MKQQSPCDFGSSDLPLHLFSSSADNDQASSPLSAFDLDGQEKIFDGQYKQEPEESPFIAALETTYSSPSIQDELIELHSLALTFPDFGDCGYAEKPEQPAFDLLSGLKDTTDCNSLREVKEPNQNIISQKLPSEKFEKRKDVVYKTMLRKCRKHLQRSFNQVKDWN